MTETVTLTGRRPRRGACNALLSARLASATGFCRGPSFLWLARAPWIWLRELMASLVKTLCRWYSTVRGLMNSWAAI
jgi:hypothetical protein